MRGILTSLILLIAMTFSQAAVFDEREIATLKSHFYENIQPNGSVLASPSKSHPDYYYHWVRDAAISMGIIAKWYEQQHLERDKVLLDRYVDWVNRVQHQPEPNPGQNILGEPKFYLSGMPFDKAWGRPQNDGPALRALALTRFATTLLKQGERDYVESRLYRSSMDQQSMGAIKLDLEYIAHHWSDKNFDLWEEVYGQHFFTEMVQRKALIMGAKLADEMNDPGAAQYYRKQARELESLIISHLDNDNRLIKATLPPHPGPQKEFELDTAIVLASLLGNTHDGFLSPEDPLVTHTVSALRTQFKDSYPINDRHRDAILYGRYPGDTYDGYSTNGQGNPWFILTATIAEYHYEIAKIYVKSRKNAQAFEAEIERGDNYLNLIKQYAPNLTMREQINLTNGEQQGAKSLTWSYGATLRAIDARQEAVRTAKPLEE